MVPKKYATWADFEKDEFLHVKSFYENLEDIMDNGLFQDSDEVKLNDDQNSGDYVREIEF